VHHIVVNCELTTDNWQLDPRFLTAHLKKKSPARVDSFAMVWVHFVIIPHIRSSVSPLPAFPHPDPALCLPL